MTEEEEDMKEVSHQGFKDDIEGKSEGNHHRIQGRWA